nr:integrase, catalytic region, zinc finger, CCHC-type, peptidase aspartic, catalytic [Tanacetum cinerariifolium]
MANLLEDIQCVGSDTRPPMLDRTDFASWKQYIRLYCRGKENAVNILKVIDEGPFQMETFRVTLSEGTEGALHLGPERPRVYSDLTPEKKDRYNVNIRATNILLQGLPKDIYSLTNHYTNAKDIWDNVKMLLEGSELTKEDRESQLYDDFEHLRQNKGETIHDYYVWFAKLINDIWIIKMTMSMMQLNSKFVNNLLPKWDRFGRENRGHVNNAWGAGAAGYGGAQNRIRYANPGQDLALNADNVFQADDCDAFDSDVDEAPTAQTMFMENLSFAYPVYDEAGPSYNSDILSEPAQNVFVTPQNNVVDKSLTAELVIYKERVKLYERRARFELTKREQKIDEQLRILIIVCNFKEENLKKELHSVKMQLASTINHNNSMVEEVTTLKKDFKQKENKYLEEFLDMKALKRKEHFEGIQKALTKEMKEMKEIFEELEAEVDQNVMHMKHDEIKRKNILITNDNLIDDCLSKDVFYTATESMLTVSRFSDMHEALNAAQKRIAELKSENSNLQNKIQNDDHDVMVLAPGRHAIDMEPIPPRIKNNREAYLDYLKHLKECVETLREIVKEAKNMIGTYPKDFNQRDKKHAATPVTRKKQVIFVDPCETSTNNTHTHAKPQTMHKTNESTIPSTGVNGATATSGSNPWSNTKKDMTLQAKSDM